MIYYFFVFYVGIISSSIIYRVIHIPSGISDLCGPVAGMVTPKGSMSTEGETLQVSVLTYRCSIGQCQSCNQVPATHVQRV